MRIISGNTPFMLQSYRPRELVRIWLVSALPDDCVMNLMTGSSPSFVSCSCGAALVAGMPLCAVPVHSGRWGAGGGDGVQETKRRRLAPNSRHEPLLERDQTQVPQYPVRGHSQRSSLYQFGGMDAFRAKVQKKVPAFRNFHSFCCNNSCKLQLFLFVWFFYLKRNKITFPRKYLICSSFIHVVVYWVSLSCLNIS